MITVGNFGKQHEMFGWASRDNKGDAMAFGVESFDQFAHIGFYIHGGKITYRKGVLHLII